MSHKFEAKISYVFLICLLMFIIIIASIGEDFSEWTLLHYLTNGGLLLLWMFITYSFFNTTYIITETNLIISVKPFYKKEISIATIKRVEKSRSLMSSPAPSFDRLEIQFGKFDSELVSPKDKKAFAETLQRLNPEIEIKL